MPESVLLIYPAPDEAKECRFGYSLPMLYVAAVLESAGYSVVFRDYAVTPYDEAAFQRDIADKSVVIVECDAFPLKRSENRSGIDTVIKRVRKYGEGLPIVVFGQMCSLTKRAIAGCDVTVIGEAETCIVELISALVREGKWPQLVVNAQPVGELDKLPRPARHLLSAAHWAQGGVFTRSALVETSRGCLRHCRFCQRNGWNVGYRVHSCQYTVEELRTLRAEGVINVWFVDDNFGYDLGRAKHLLKEIARCRVAEGMRIALSTSMAIDEEFLDAAKAAGVSIISTGIESASRDIQSFYRKPVDLERARRMLAYADSLGIYNVCNFIIGAPQETEETIGETVAFIQAAAIDEVNVKILDYMIGSELYASLGERRTIGRSHVFACEEEGLCGFSDAALRERAMRIVENFRVGRAERLRRKIAQWGPPYVTRDVQLGVSVAGRGHDGLAAIDV